MLKVLVVVVVLALIVYGFVRLLQQRTGGPTPRVTGPDDDPDFLRGLDRRINPDRSDDD